MRFCFHVVLKPVAASEAILLWVLRVSSNDFTCVPAVCILNNGCHEEGYEEGSCTPRCTCGTPSHEEGHEGQGNEGDEKVKACVLKLVAQTIKDQLR